MKKILIIIALPLLFSSCEKDETSSGPVKVEFILYNNLLWNIGYNYQVGGTDASGNAFKGKEVYIQYLNVLLDSKEVKHGTTLTLYKNGNAIWTSEPVTRGCTISYTDNPSPIDDEVIIQ